MCNPAVAILGTTRFLPSYTDFGDVSCHEISTYTMFLPSYTDFGGCVLPRNFKIDPINCLQQFSFLKS